MQFFAAGEKKDRAHGECHRHPGRQRQGDGAKQISVNVERGYDQPDIRLAFVILLADVLAVENRKPDAKHDEAAGEGDEMLGIEQVKHAAGERQHRKGTDAAWTFGIGTREKILECQPKKQAQAQKEADTGQGGC